MPRPSKEKLHLTERLHEIIFELHLEGFNGEEIGTMLKLHRSTVNRVIAKLPRNWKPRSQRKTKE